MKKAISILCAITMVIGMVFCCGATASAEEPTILYSEEIFDGYSGIENTTSGKIGYNHAVPLPNGEVVKLGFAPSNAVYREVYDEEFSLGLGWNFKIARISEVDGQKYLYQTNGKVYEIDEELNIVNYPSEHTLTLRADGTYLLEEPFGYFSLFDTNGRLVSSVDSYAKVTSYVYDENGLKEIRYSDGSVFRVNYAENDGTETLRCFYISSAEATSMLTITIANDRLIRMQDAQAGQLLFAYTQDGLLSYFLRDESDRVLQYETSITGKRLSKKFIALDGVTTEYNYGYNAEGLLVTDTTVGQGTVTYTYQQDANGNLTTIRQENFGAGTFWTANTKNELGQTVSFSSPYGLTETTYDANNRLIKQQDYGDTSETITMAYNDHGQVATETFASSGEVVTHTYLANGVKDKEISSVRGVIYERPETTPVREVVPMAQPTISFSGNSSDYPNKKISVSGLGNIGYVGVAEENRYSGRYMSSFNCYMFAINTFGFNGNPGQLADRNSTKTKYSSLNDLMHYFVYDQISLGRIYNTTQVSTSIASNQWKVSMMVRSTEYVHQDYHFLKKNNNSSPWDFKAGRGSILVLLNGATPNTIQGDSYRHYYDETGTLCCSVEFGYYPEWGLHYMLSEG